jgi:predicted negative regulator of RcsB-dependent stress response
MTGLYADMRGDILLTQGNRAEARSAYQLALDRTEAGSQYRGVIEAKLDSVGDAK